MFSVLLKEQSTEKVYSSNIDGLYIFVWPRPGPIRFALIMYPGVMPVTYASTQRLAATH